MALQQPSATGRGGVQRAPPTPVVQEVIVARDIKVADPGPLGLGAFAMTTFILSMFNAELVRGTGLPVVFGVALMYGGIAQILAGMWEFRAGNTFGATAFTSFGAFWLSYWALVQFYLGDIVKAGAAGKAVGLYLIAWGIFSLYMFVATFRINVGLVVVFGLLVITFALLGIGQARSYRSRPGPGSGAAADRGPPFLGAGRRRAPRRAARRERHRDHRPALREARLGPRSTRPGVSSTPYLMTFALDSVGDVFGSLFLSVAGMLVMKIGVLPRWLGWLSICAGILLLLQGFCVGGVIGTFGRVLDLIGFLLFLIFVLVSSVALLRRGDAVPRTKEFNRAEGKRVFVAGPSDQTRASPRPGSCTIEANSARNRHSR